MSVIPSDSSASLTSASEALDNKAAASKGSEGSNVTFKSVEDLRTKEPELYNLIITGMATRICQQEKRHYDRIKQMAREQRSGG